MSGQRFVVDYGDHLVTHDGNIQLGVFYHSLEDHLRLNPTVDWQVTYWAPDTFQTRYSRVNYQHHMKANEGSPRTDNSDGYPQQATNRLERTV